MKYKVGDKIRQNGEVLWVGGKDKIITISARINCYYFPCYKINKIGPCSGNLYQFEEGDITNATDGYCFVEEESELWKWKPRKPKKFKLKNLV